MAVLRLAFVGDSFVNGTGDRMCLGWTGRVCALAMLRGHHITHYSLGVRRDTSSDIAARWRAEVSARLPADCDGRVVFSFGANDVCAGDDDGQRVSHARTLANAEAILNEARSRWPVLLVGPLPIADDPAASARAAVLGRALGELCAGLGVPYLNPYPDIAESRVWLREARSGDGAHPDAGGYEALAALVDGWDAWRAWVP